ncbi:MAG: CoA ester lyase [Alphaproteobacteria bacterium]|nr:CoA ester lyase [Alphaproteobacteria bacterium]MBU1549776.1 CoA ester lyase [Alphaproteobacteria bacterium]MBU2336769.1 CoA ester lyase [Alphaproteobacteria bacterium]MBU2387502.1 CoA ester lyase [Alphaproteobacteria bacterium]
MTFVTFPSAPVSPPRRSCLSVPAINRRALDKTHGLDCDMVIFDLEDSVSPDKKAEARDNLRRFFRETPLAARETVIRINGADSQFRRQDVELVLELEPDAVLLPKVEDPGEIRQMAEALANAPESLRVWAMMETPLGVLNAAAIAATARQAGGRLDCLVIGLNDLRKATGVPPQPGRVYLVPWMMQVVLAARAHGLDVIDSVFNDFRDADGFVAECAQGSAMGFDGKMLIHPAQIEAANESFGPAPEAIAEAEAIVAAFRQPNTADLNVINLNGRMVERLHLEEAERLLARLHLIESRKTSA